MRRNFLFVVSVVVVLILVVWTLATPQPYTQDSRIQVNSMGVLQITAESLNDAFYLMGWAHAQNRLWQMDMFRLIGTGRLSSRFGYFTIDLDRFFRTVGFPSLAKSNYQALPMKVKKALISYANGVNESVAEINRLPLEYWVTWSSWD